MRIVKIILLGIVAVGMLSLVACDKDEDERQTEKPATAAAGQPAQTLAATGCLQKGDEADEFAITGADGKNYELVSSAVKLSEHVGHKVSVTGTAIGEKNEENEKKEQGEGWAGRINVSSLKMVSESCK